MSIELSGPKGYDVQYLVTLWLALLAEFAAPGKASVRVEEKEDAEGTLVISGSTIRIAMQSKHEKGDLDISKLARWLAHFGPRNDSECLLGRVLRDERQIALFVTRTRCDDDTRAFLKLPGEWQANAATPLKRKITRILAGELAKVYDPNRSSLQKRRAKECVRLSSVLGAKEAKNALQRVVVWEQITSARVEKEISNLLNKFRVVARKTVMDALLGEVKAARDSRGELMPGLRHVLRAHAADRILHESHTPRAEDTLLAAELEKKRVLWLTGRSHSGKTHTGQTLAQDLQNGGAICLQTDDLKTARAFLAPDALEKRLVLLDDPLLQATAPLRTWEAISKLAASLPIQHRLIVTAKLEHLIDFDPLFSSRPTDMFGCTWRDLTASDRQFLLQYWGDLTQQQTVPPPVFAAIADYLKSCDSRELLQPGQLRHLAHMPADQLSGQCPDELLRLARFNARQLAREIAQNQNSRMLSFALGMGATTKSGIQSLEIAFLHSDASERPAVVQDDDDQSQSDEPPTFPTYGVPPVLSAEAQGFLREFERRGFITFVNERFHFSHPDYREAFQERLLLEVGSGVEDVLAMLDRACGALDPAVGVSATRFMGLWLRTLQPGEATLIQRILKIGFHGLRSSIFPNVRTAAMLSLLQQLDRLSEKQAEELLRVALSFDDDMDSVVWSDEHAWLHQSGSRWVRFVRNWFANLQRGRRRLSAESVASAIARLRDFHEAAEISGQEADAVNTAYLLQDEPQPDVDVLVALLNREEVFIRADAAQVVMSSACAAGEKLRQRVFEDEHPLVLSRAIRAAFEHWRSYSSVAQADLRLRIRATLSDPVVAAISSRWLFDLGDEHSYHHHIRWPSWNDNEKRGLWSLWGDAIGAALRTLGPRRFLMNSGDFRNSTRVASEWLTPEEACRFAEAWMEWIEEQTKLRSLDDYATSIAKFLLDATQAQPALREDLTARALRLIETDALAHSLCAFVDEWRALAGRERKAVWRLLRSARKDVEWLRAVVLTRVEPPSDLICLIASRPDFFHLSPKEQIATLPAPLLAKCLQLLTGPAGWGTRFGIPMSATIVWERILNVQLSALDQPHFVLAVTHLLFNAVNRATEVEPALVGQWTALCDAADEATRAILFRELLNVSLNVLHSRLGPFWKAFFALVIREDERGRYVEEIVENLEGLSYSHEKWRELVELFGPEFFLDEILKHSTGDFVACLLVRAVPTPNESVELAPTILELINALYQKSRPRILPIHDRIARWLEAMDTVESRQLAAKIKEIRSAGIEMGSDQKNARRPFEQELRDWIAQSAE